MQIGKYITARELTLLRELTIKNAHLTISSILDKTNYKTINAPLLSLKWNSYECN